MTKRIENKSVWWREPMVWLIVTLPMLAVVAGLTTVWIAYQKADTVIGDNDSQGVGVTQANDMDKRAHFLSLSADLTVMNGGMLNITLSGKLAKKPQRLLLNLSQPTGSDSGANIVLAHQSGQKGEYNATLPFMLSGQRKLVLEPEDRSWRLTGLWQAPFSGSVHLAARSISDSTMLP